MRLATRPLTSILLATGFLLALAAGAGLLTASSPAARAQDEPACSATPNKTASPARVQLGEHVTVTLQVEGDCPSRERKADVVLVIDRSSSMGRDNKLVDAKAAATAFVDAMDPTLIHVGVVAFDDVVEDIIDLSDDPAALRRAIAGIAMDRGTNLVDSLERGRRMVLGPSSRADAQPVIIFLTDGNHSVSTPPIGAIDTVIAAVRTDGIDAYSIGLGNDADSVLLRRIASDPSKYYGGIRGGQLGDIYLQIGGRIEAAVLFETITIADEVPANMRYINGSARPGALWDSTTRVLTWTFADIPEPGFSLTYRLEPQEAGTHPTNVRADADFEDGFGNEASLHFPVPEVVVEGPPGDCICRVTRLRVPQHAIDFALAHPERVLGWRDPLDPNLRPGELENPRRLCLDLRNRNTAWHPLFNRVLWRAGCLIGPDLP